MHSDYPIFDPSQSRFRDPMEADDDWTSLNRSIWVGGSTHKPVLHCNHL